MHGKEKEEIIMGNSYTDSMLSSNDRRRVLTTMMNEHRGLAIDYSGQETLNSFLYDHPDDIKEAMTERGGIQKFRQRRQDTYTSQQSMSRREFQNE